VRPMSRGRCVPVVQTRVLAPEAEQLAASEPGQPTSQRSLSPVALGLVASRTAWFEGRGTADASLRQQGEQLQQPFEQTSSMLDEASSSQDAASTATAATTATATLALWTPVPVDAAPDPFPGTPPREANASATSLGSSPAAVSSPKSPWTSATVTTAASSSAFARRAASTASAFKAVDTSVGSPVTFFLDGATRQYFGRTRSVSPTGRYCVDLIGGGRCVHLDAVTPCTEADLAKSEQSRQGMRYMTPRSASASRHRTTLDVRTPRQRSPPRKQVTHGTPVSFFTDRSRNRERIFGRVRQVLPDSTLTVDLADGGCCTGVGQALNCSEEDLAHVVQKLQRDHMRTARPPYWEYQTRNARLDSALPGMPELPSGCPVSFFDAKSRTRGYGRLRFLRTNGTENSYFVDVVGGGAREVLTVSRCTEEAYSAAVAEVARCRKPWKSSMDTSPSQKGLFGPATRECGMVSHTGGGVPMTPRSTSTPNLRGVAIAAISRCQRHLYVCRNSDVY